ncbi:alpha/beta fold hydrolase [Propionibacteriaceae bacterium G1746]|uniref:alpha/beta fold hydrolase n=1 Tax=Aestuariimicrobium sp. G57 TaxID=3418485 RepID=UPI003C2423B0
MHREIALYTLEGVRDARVTHHPFTTTDGLGLSMIRFNRDPLDEARDVVVIIHGLTTSSDMFIMPEHRNLVTHLLEGGFPDVFTLDMRMSNRHSYNLFPHRYSMDDVALYDYPPALALVRDLVGPDRRIHVIAHCLGSVSFLLALFGKAVTGITSVVANSVGLTPRVPSWSRLKLKVAPALVEYVLGFPNLNPRWSQDPGFTPGELFSRGVSLFHRECDVPACHMLSMMWGTGWPALYEHENLADVTHRRGGDLYGATSMNYYRHVRKMVEADGHPLKYDPRRPDLSSLPDDYWAGVRDIATPVLFTTGANNRVFTDSNIVNHARLRDEGCDQHELVVYPGYGHQDVFMGKDVARDCFPQMVDFMTRMAADRVGV